MGNFGYEATDDAGVIKKGNLTADNIEKAEAELRGQGLTIISLTEQGALSQDINLSFGGKPSSRDLSVFCRQFVSMTRAGVTIIEALRMLEEQTENVMLKKAIEGVRNGVEKGDTLANSLAEYPKVFPTLMVHMIMAGEASGNLEVAFDRMALQFEKAEKTRSMVKKAMIYPIIVSVVAIVVVIIMLVVVIPSYTETFASLDAELPKITVGVVNASNFVIHYWYVLLAIAVGLVLGIRKFRTTPMGKKFFGGLALKIPVFKNLTVKSASALMARTLSTLIAAGVSLPDAVEIVAGTMENVYFKEALLNAREQIIIGVPLSKPLRDCGLFPPMVYHMVRIGEESGNIEDMLVKLADYYDEEVESATQNLMAVMEPMIILVLAGIVAFLIASILAPMMGLYDAVGNM